MSASSRGKEVTNLTKARLISLVLIASLFAYSLACLGIVKGFGMCDGGGLL
jgi:heme O synthase-like polyprenyltransferase